MPVSLNMHVACGKFPLGKWEKCVNMLKGDAALVNAMHMPYTLHVHVSDVSRLYQCVLVQHGVFHVFYFDEIVFNI